jgi:RNA polymerase sigma-70 factor (ECF subfamily)
VVPAIPLSEGCLNSGHLCASDKSSAELIAVHAPRVWRSLRYLGVSPQELADACQEVFLVMHRSHYEFQGKSKYETWVYGICAGVARNVRRTRLRNLKRFEPLTVEPSYDPMLETAVDARRARDILNGALEQLSDEQREVFVLRCVEELPMNQVALAVSCPLFTAYSRLRLARKKLSTILKGGK